MTLIVVVACMAALYSINSVSATPPCAMPLPYASEFENYYEDVDLDSCYGYSFVTPASYSRFNINYRAGSVGIPGDTMEEFDSNLRKIISIGEECPKFEQFAKLADRISDDGTLGLALFPPVYFENGSATGISGVGCQDFTSTVDYYENLDMINGFLSHYNGDYDRCVWEPLNGMSTTFGGRVDFVEDAKSTYVICDGTMEFFVYTLGDDGKIKEAYFANSGSEIYRKIYPEDVALKPRYPAWEKERDAKIAIAAGAIVVVALALFLKFGRKPKAGRAEG